MKASAFLLIALATSAVAGEVIPSAFAKDRYKEMFAMSPFYLETVPPLPPPPSEDPFAGVYVSSMSLGESGRTVVYVKRSTDERGIRLVGNEVDEGSGFSVENVDWANGWKSATVTARHRGGAVKTLVFDPKNTTVRTTGPLLNGPAKRSTITNGSKSTGLPPPPPTTGPDRKDSRSGILVTPNLNGSQRLPRR